ncbi:MAG: phage tail sheath family protein [bacterium]|nr:phage tail sheath family protein [bacterium]
MPEYLAPGVYLEEFEIGAKPIEGVSTSTLGILGETERGPVVPKLVTNFEDYRRAFGGYMENSFLPNALEGFFMNGGKRCFVGRVIGKGAKTASYSIGGGAAPPPPKEGEKGKAAAAPKGGKAALLQMRATGPGEWGNNVAVKIADAGLALDGKFANLFKMTVVYWREKPAKVVDPTVLENEKDPDYRMPSRVEIYDNLSPVVLSGDNYQKKISGVSVLIDIAQLGDGRPDNMGLTFLDGGTNGNKISLEEYKGNSDAGVGKESGLLGFEQVDDIAILQVPNENDIEGLSGVAVAHCEAMKDRFAILNCKASDKPAGTLMTPLDSKCAAFYYPWIYVMDPLTGRKKMVPPGGHVAGVYARSDTERGVHKAPANEVLRGVLELQFPISKGKQDVLNPRGVNCIRAFPGRGIRIWGARTVSSDPLWKYVNVRRLFLYVGESIEEGTQWVVFEPSSEQLWARVKQTVTQFLTGVWKSGALMGTSAEEAFFVRCDRSTMTQDDIDNGRLVCVIGIAPVKPAEFVILRIAQWQGGSAAQE